MSTIVEPELPAIVPPGDGPHTQELEQAYNLFCKELESSEDWQDYGEQEGTQLYWKPDPEDAYAVPTVKGEAVVPNATPDEFLAVLQLPGMRKRWDGRFQNGQILQRYNRHSYAFYTVMKGMGWLVWERDIVGAHKNYRSDGEIKVVQVSIEEPESAPVQDRKTRATLTVSGWQLQQQSDGSLKVTYVVKIALNGSIPSAMVSKLAVEIPTCVGRAQKVFETIGHAPYVLPTEDQPEPTVIFQTEGISDPTGYYMDQPGDLKYFCKFTTSADGKFDLKYSTKMYDGGVQAFVEGSSDAVEVTDDGNGTVHVKCNKADENVSVCIEPK
ncbi:hypothetical protein OIO90_005091 [Microbotryomycetes sp. JL221]|nr:hypothetical protein OIO90_005091 [Microbotryomycetes sp. JL221]